MQPDTDPWNLLEIYLQPLGRVPAESPAATGKTIGVKGLLKLAPLPEQGANVNKAAPGRKIGRPQAEKEEGPKANYPSKAP